MKRTLIKATQSVMIAASVVFFMSSCKKEDAKQPAAPVYKGETATVKFELDASKLNFVTTKAYTPEYDENGFAIYAFRQEDGGTDYIFEQEVVLDNVAYLPAEQKVTGTEELLIGNYKFIATYGIKNQPGIINTIIPSGTVLTDNLYLTFNGNSPMTEIFLPTDMNVADLDDYDIGIMGTNPVVTETIKRAVSRVDVMFIRATKTGPNQYEERPYDGADNVFQQRALTDFRLTFGNVNGQMTLFGVNDPQPINSYQAILDNLTQRLTLGNGTSTDIGTPDFTRYDNIREGDLNNGFAHIFGTYLLPNNNSDKTTNLSIYFKVDGVAGRNIDVSYDADHRLPIERNKITLVKIYVLSEYAITSGVEFEVDIDTVWEDPNEVTGEISK